jgi:8-amino-7-oxononanoate synthase
VTAPLSRDLRVELDALTALHRRRSPKTLAGAPGARVLIDGAPRVNFASNNYLGLAEDPRVRRAAARAARRWGAGATASRLMGGTLELHRELEREIADLKRRPAALVFPSGYHANTGMIPALAGPEDTVVLDRLAHASLVDGARLSRARLRVFQHNDPEDLDRVLARLSGPGRPWVVTESVFSMDGDRAPLAEIVAVAERRGARTYVDEAHGTGVWGPSGAGWVNALGLSDRVDVAMGTLSKAFASQGGFVCGASELIDWAVNRARAFIYSTALAPAATAAALEAVRIARVEPDRRERLFALARRLRTGLGLSGEGPIVPWVLGTDAAAVALSQRLWERGVFAPAVRPPTVPKGTARIRFSLTAAHTEADIDAALAAVRAGA